MKKFTNFIAIVGGILAILMVIHAIRWGNVQMERTRRSNEKWRMEWLSRR